MLFLRNRRRIGSTMIAVIWMPPREEFELFVKFTGEQFDSYDQYLERVDSVSKALLSSDEGSEVDLRFASVADMERWLKKAGLENTPENRAIVIGKRWREKKSGKRRTPYRLGIKLGEIVKRTDPPVMTIGWARIGLTRGTETTRKALWSGVAESISDVLKANENYL